MSIARFPVAFAVAVVLGALLHVPIPVVIAVIVMVAALLARSRTALIVAGFLIATALATDARAGLRPSAVSSIDEVVIVESDPNEVGTGLRVDVQSSIGRLEAVSYGSIARGLANVSVGFRVHVQGRVGVHPHPDRVMARHVRGRLAVTGVEVVGQEMWSVPIDLARGAVASGADGLPVWQRPIYLGFVLGDDRGSSPATVDDFERSGLSHLLVVSGENVAFLLLVASPIIARMGRRQRLIATLALLVVFAAMTRFEPSVLRAVTMAGVVSVGISTGRRSSGVGVLANAVAILVLIDPLLVASLGFRLSVAATLGILTLAPRITAVVRGPRWIATGLGVCVAAQIAVAPLLVPVFGPLRLISVPANVLAEPAAAFVMMWGCTGGVVAGAIGGPIGMVLQLPTRLAIWWIAGIAACAAHLPSPELDLVGLSLVVAIVCASVTIRRRLRARRPASLAV